MPRRSSRTRPRTGGPEAPVALSAHVLIDFRRQIPAAVYHPPAVHRRPPDSQAQLSPFFWPPGARVAANDLLAARFSEKLLIYREGVVVVAGIGAPRVLIGDQAVVDVHLAPDVVDRGDCP